MFKAPVCFFFFIFLFPFSIKGQINLVPNPSFEDTVANPSGGVMEDASGWINCGLTPDYYNPAFNGDGFGFGVPDCFYTGYQNALDGNSFAGLGLTQIPEQPGEFIGIQLTQPLMIGTKYYVSAYISRADDFQCSTNNFGFRFFNTLYFSPPFNTPPIDNFAQITSSTIVSDSMNWSFISGSFIADSAYQYLVIGNFYNLSLTDTLGCYSSDLSYYYVDAICVSSDSLYAENWTGIHLYSESEIRIYPNPASTFITVEFFPPQSNFTIIDLAGRKIESGFLEGAIDQIDLTLFPDGIYFLILNNDQSFKIAINH